MNRFVAPLVGLVVTLSAVAAMLFFDVSSAIVLLVAAGGAPLTVLLLVAAVTDPAGSRRTVWPSLVMGGLLIPPLVILLHGVFLALGFVLVEPFADAGRELLDELRADPSLVDILTSGWTYFFIVELAVVAPLAEESLKPLAAIVRRPRNATDAFLFGAAAGTGFAIVENVMYASGWFWGPSEYWLPVSLARMMGAAIHAFGAGLVAWGVYRVQSRAERGWRDLGRAFVTAASIHGVWNGTIAITEVVYAGRSEIAAALSDDAGAWGVTLLVVLAIMGALVLGGLLHTGRGVRTSGTPLRAGMLEGLKTPQGVAAWALVSTTLLVPATILVLVFPDLITL